MAQVANPPLARLELSLPMCAKDLRGGHGMRRNPPGDPGQIEEMAAIDVFGRDVAAPGSAG